MQLGDATLVGEADFRRRFSAPAASQGALLFARAMECIGVPVDHPFFNFLMAVPNLLIVIITVPKN